MAVRGEGRPLHACVNSTNYFYIIVFYTVNSLLQQHTQKHVTYGKWVEIIIREFWNFIREKSGKNQGILFSWNAGNPDSGVFCENSTYGWKNESWIWPWNDLTDFRLILLDHTTNFRFQLRRSSPLDVYEAILYIAVAYFLLRKLNYDYHNQTPFH